MAKSDPVIPITAEDAGESLVEWFRRNSRQLAIGAMAVAAIAAIAFLWRASAVKKEMRASEALAAAQMVVQSGNAALAQSDLQALIRRYDGTSSAIQGRMLLAQVYFSQGKTDEGLRELDAIDSPGLYAASVHGLRGAGLEQAGKPAEAAAAYEEASEAADTPGAKANYRADAARAYLAAGNTEAAKRIWTELASDDTSPLSGEAKVRLGELNAKPAG
ncbi:MAG TPA: tetratricopeptide repeat protein [Gemmatimonadaceae bacterium]